MKARLPVRKVCSSPVLWQVPRAWLTKDNWMLILLVFTRLRQGGRRKVVLSLGLVLF